MSNTVKMAMALLVAGTVTAGFSEAPEEEMTAASQDSMEKCYGIVKAGANDCAGAGHSCAGQASADASGTEFIVVPAGTCEKLAGGSTTSS